MAEPTKRPKTDESSGVKAIPEGYNSVTPYLCIKGVKAAIDLYKNAFGATELVIMDGPNDTVMHAEIKIGDSVVMMSDEFPSMDVHAPPHYGGSPSHLMIYTEDCDAMFKKAITLGCTEQRPLKTQFYGDRSGTLVDPFGHRWTIATHVEDVTPEEMERRMAAMSEKSSEKCE